MVVDTGIILDTLVNGPCPLVPVHPTHEHSPFTGSVHRRLWTWPVNTACEHG